MSEESRNKFEEWTANHDYLGGIELHRGAGGDYADMDLQHAYESWEAAQSELSALREELATAKRNEHNSEVAYKAAIEKQGELRDELAYYKKAENMPNKVLAWRGLNVYDEVVTDWIEGDAPETMYDLQDRAAHYHKIERAYSAPETELVAVVEYTGYEPSNSLKWQNKGLGFMKPGTKLYAVQPTESGAGE